MKIFNSGHPLMSIKKARTENSDSNIIAKAPESDEILLQEIQPLKNTIEKVLSSVPNTDLDIISELKLHKPDNAKSNNLVSYRSPNRKRIEWKTDEVEALLKGHELYGESWHKILSAYSDIFNPKRRAIDLVHKFDQLHKKSSFYKTSKKNWVQVYEDGTLKIDTCGEIVCFSEKFPYDAAVKFAKRQEFMPCDVYKITIRECEDISNVHSYKVTVNGNKLYIIKLVADEN